MTVHEVLAKSSQFLKQKGIDHARLDSEILMAKALGWRRIDLYLQSEYPLTSGELDICREFVKRRATGEPAAYILGEKEFYGHRFAVGPGVLIPRPETEHIVDEAITFANQIWETPRKAQSDRIQIVDLGTGSGCIGISILKSVPHAHLLGIDISGAAVARAQANSKSLEVAERCEFQVVDAGAWAAEGQQNSFDILVANPPYLSLDDPRVQPSVRQFEPHEALFSPENGLYHIRRWLELSGKLLRPGGLLLMEIGADQALSTQEVVSGTPFTHVQMIKDYSGHDRVLRATRREV